MSDEPNQTQPAVSEQKRKISRLALPLAFLPSVLLIGGISVLSTNLVPQFFQSAVVLGILCIVCIACCFTASILMFRRKTVVAVVFGILFLLLNAAISFFFGCATVLTGAKF
jgi:O-antigen/teichoic acid export membrane protein